MRLWILPIAALVGFVVGCNKSPEGGTPQSDSSFKLSLPAGTKDVKLTVEAPKQLDIKLTKQEIKASDPDTKFSITVTAAKDAPIGEHTIKIVGTPSEGSPTAGEFKLKVTG